MTTMLARYVSVIGTGQSGLAAGYFLRRAGAAFGCSVRQLDGPASATLEGVTRAARAAVQESREALEAIPATAAGLGSASRGGTACAVLIVGGSDAGISAALRARELDASAEATVLLADDFPNWSICGLPYYLSGEAPDWRSLAHRTEFEGIRILRSHRAERIDLEAKSVAVSDPREAMAPFAYDRLIVATGARPIRPDLPGMDLPAVHLLHTMGDALDVNKLLEQDQPPRSAVIVGAGYIGLEMAEALAHRGLEVTVLSRSDPVFPTVDPQFGRAIQEELAGHGVRVLAGAALEAITHEAGFQTPRRKDELRGRGARRPRPSRGWGQAGHGARCNGRDQARADGCDRGGPLHAHERWERPRCRRLRRDLAPDPRPPELSPARHDGAQARPGRR